MHTLLILKGNVGSGKSTLAKSLKGFRYLDIDQYYLKVGREKKSVGWHKDLKSIKKAYQMLYKDVIRYHNQNLVIESAGVNENWKWILPKLKRMKDVRVIQVYVKTPVWLCKQRVRHRNKTKDKHTNLSFVDFISKLWHKNRPPYDYVIDGRLSQKEARAKLRLLLTKNT
jgi:predicted kinase